MPSLILLDVVMLTDLIEQDLQLQSASAVGVLAKPVSAEKLVEVARRHCGDAKEES